MSSALHRFFFFFTLTIIFIEDSFLSKYHPQQQQQQQQQQKSFSFALADDPQQEEEEDILPDCIQRAARGHCRMAYDVMKEACSIACANYEASGMGLPHMDQKMLSPDDDENDSFFQLKARNAFGKMMEFDQFEGYVTIVVNAARVCDIEKYYNYLEHTHSVWPWSLEILVFPHPQTLYRSNINDPTDNTVLYEKLNEQCPDWKDHDVQYYSSKKQKSKIHIMEQIELNGPQAHPVYKFMRRLFFEDDDEENAAFDETFATFFVISPNGQKIEAHYGSNYEAMKHYIIRHLKEDYYHDL